MSDDLYYTDILTWSEHQGDLLRRLAAGERVNDQVDWENVIEEIDSVGREQLNSVVSLLGQALRHMIKAECWPLHRDAPSWRADAIDFRQQARNRYAASMRQKIDMNRLWRDALRALPETMDGQPPLPVQSERPSLEELLADEP